MSIKNPKKKRMNHLTMRTGWMRLNLLTIADGCRLEFIAERGKKNA